MLAFFHFAFVHVSSFVLKGLPFSLCSFLFGILLDHLILNSNFPCGSSDVSSMLESDDAIPTATAVTSSMNYSHSLSRRTRKGDGDGVYRPSSVDGG